MVKLTKSQIKYIKQFCEGLHSEPDWREVVENITDAGAYMDFEVDNVRFIHTDEIDQIQREELASDLYCLGCFNASFLAGLSGMPLDQEDIEAMQEAEAYEAIGKIIDKNCLDELQAEYASADGYGHHFNHYDFGEEELRVSGLPLFHVFDNH